MSKILVTGACGFVGSNMVNILLAEGFDVRATDLNTSAKCKVQNIEIGTKAQRHKGTKEITNYKLQITNGNSNNQQLTTNNQPQTPEHRTQNAESVGSGQWVETGLRPVSTWQSPNHQIDNHQSQLRINMVSALQNPESPDYQITKSPNYQITVSPADITKKEDLAPLFDDVDTVFHIASIFNFSTPLEVLRKVNVDGTRNICEISLEKGIKRFIHLSTVGVYGIPSWHTLPINENAARMPSNNYETSKQEQEDVAIEFLKKGLPITILRPGPIYGIGNKYFVWSLIQLIKRFPFVPLPTNIQNRIAGCNVADVCSAMLFLAKQETTIGEIFNIVDDSTYTVGEFLNFLSEFLGKRSVSLPMPLFAFSLGINLSARLANYIKFMDSDMIKTLQYDYWYSNEKIKKAGYTLKYPDIKEGLRESIGWYNIS